MNDNTTISFTFDDESGQLEGANAENTVLKELSDLNYDRVTKDAVIGVVPTEDGYSIRLVDNINSAEYLKEIPGYNKITQLIDQTNKITDILPEGVSVDDYNYASVCCVRYLFEKLLEQKKRLYICYDNVDDRIILTRDQHKHYVELYMTTCNYTDRLCNTAVYFDMNYDNLANSVNLVFKIYDEDGIEKTVPVNPFYYTLQKAYYEGVTRTALCFTNTEVQKDAKAFVLVAIKAIDGDVEHLLMNKVVQNVENGNLTLYSIQYKLQEILYSVTLENTPDIPKLYLTNDANGNLIWDDLNAVTLHSDGVTIKKKNVFFNERTDYGNIDYDIRLGFNPDEDILDVEFKGIRNYDENAILVIADNQFQTNYQTDFKNETLKITFPEKSFSSGIADDGQIGITVILLTSSDVERSDFAKDYITRKEALKLFNGERLNIDGFVTDAKLDSILREYGYNIARDEFGDRVAFDVRLRYAYDTDIVLRESIDVNKELWPNLKNKYVSGKDSLRQILTDMLNPYMSAEEVTNRYVKPVDIGYTLYKRDINAKYYKVDGNSLYYEDNDNIYIEFHPVNSLGEECSFTAGNIRIDLQDISYNVNDRQLVKMAGTNLYHVKSEYRLEPLGVSVTYSLPDVLIDSYGKAFPIEDVGFPRHDMVLTNIILNIDFPNIIAASVPFYSDLDISDVEKDYSVNTLDNAFRTNGYTMNFKVSGSKYVFIAIEDKYDIYRIIDTKSGSVINDIFERSNVKAIPNKDNYNVYEYRFGRDDIDTTYEIYIKEV